MGRIGPLLLALSMSVILSARPASGQVTPAPAAPAKVDDAPSVRVGGTIFADYTYTFDPKITDIDGNSVSPNSMNVARTYINVQGQLNHVIQFRITPDIARETGTGSSLAGSTTFRLKYGYAQINLDDWMWQGTYARAGMIQTPYVEYEESIYRYRFQGPTFVDREGFMPSADFGAILRTQFPKQYGEVYGGIYNGEGYTRFDPNNQKALQIRGTLRPFPKPGTLQRGLRLTGFYGADHYVRDAERNRFVSMVSFEHRYLNAAWVYLDAADQTSVNLAKTDSTGHSVWLIPRSPTGFEGLFRYDRLEQTQNTNETKKERVIAGIAYWPKFTVTSVTASFLLDFESVRYRRYTPFRSAEQRLTLHMLLAF